MAIVGSMNLEFAGGGEANARDIAELFVRQGYIIVGNENIPAGIVTEWDYVNKILSKEADASKVPLSHNWWIIF